MIDRALAAAGPRRAANRAIDVMLGARHRVAQPKTARQAGRDRREISVSGAMGVERLQAFGSKFVPRVAGQKDILLPLC